MSRDARLSRRNIDLGMGSVGSYQSMQGDMQELRHKAVEGVIQPVVDRMSKVVGLVTKAIDGKATMSDVLKVLGVGEGEKNARPPGATHKDKSGRWFVPDAPEKGDKKAAPAGKAFGDGAFMIELGPKAKRAGFVIRETTPA